MRNVNPEWFYGWNLEPDWDAIVDGLIDLVDTPDEPEMILTLVDLDEPLCNFEGKPVDDCRCTF